MCNLYGKKPKDFNAVPESRFQEGWFKQAVPEFEPKDERARERKYLQDYKDEMKGLESLTGFKFRGNRCVKG